MNVKCRSYVLNPHIADHYAVSLVFDATINNTPNTIRFRDFSLTNIEKFMQENTSELSSFTDDYLDSNDYCQCLAKCLHILEKNYSPLKIKTMTHKWSSTPWLTKNVIKCTDKKHA